VNVSRRIYSRAAYAQAAGSECPIIVLTFRASIARLDTPMFVRPPFFRPRWFPDIADVAIDDRTD